MALMDHDVCFTPAALFHRLEPGKPWYQVPEDQPASFLSSFLTRDIRSWVFCSKAGEDAAAKFSRQQQTLWLELVPTLYPDLLMNQQPVRPFPMANYKTACEGFFLH